MPEPSFDEDETVIGILEHYKFEGVYFISVDNSPSWRYGISLLSTGVPDILNAQHSNRFAVLLFFRTVRRKKMHFTRVFN
jgi:hypothetical protein